MTLSTVAKRRLVLLAGVLVLALLLFLLINAIFGGSDDYSSVEPPLPASVVIIDEWEDNTGVSGTAGPNRAVLAISEPGADSDAIEAAVVEAFEADGWILAVDPDPDTNRSSYYFVREGGDIAAAVLFGNRRVRRNTDGAARTDQVRDAIDDNAVPVLIVFSARSVDGAAEADGSGGDAGGDDADNSDGGDGDGGGGNGGGDDNADDEAGDGGGDGGGEDENSGGEGPFGVE